MSTNCDSILRLVREHFLEQFAVRALDQESCILRIPFRDSMGDPVQLVVSLGDTIATVDDGGRIAGQLFSLGQHTVDTPSFRLLRSIAEAHDLAIDFDEGIVRISVPREQLIDGVMELIKVLLTMLTASPQLRVSPRRLRVFGPRVRSQIRRDYFARNILDLVEPYYQIPGTAVEFWPVDYHWFVREAEESRDVYVLAVDLDVSDPLRKAERIAALAVDTRRRIEGNYLRVVMDTHGMNSQADVAASFLTQHSQSLGFRVIDFGKVEERELFVNQSADEILGEEGAPWRRLWMERST